MSLVVSRGLPNESTTFTLPVEIGKNQNQEEISRPDRLWTETCAPFSRGPRLALFWENLPTEVNVLSSRSDQMSQKFAEKYGSRWH
jgi:hypothetical protein